jgi:hypothetical protein
VPELVLHDRPIASASEAIGRDENDTTARGLFDRRAQGSAMSAHADPAIGTPLSLVQVAAAGVVFPKLFGSLGRLSFCRRSNRDRSLRMTAP